MGPPPTKIKLENAIMASRKHCGPMWLETFLLEHNPDLGEHVRDGRIIRSSNILDEIAAARARCEDRRTRWYAEITECRAP